MTRTPSSTDDPQPGRGRSRDKAEPQHCDQEVTCMDYPSYCEENETPCPLVNCKRRGTASDTPQTDTGKQPERHCDHERVCMWLLESERRSVCPQTCEHDTRSCPSLLDGLSEKEVMLLSAGLCVGSIASGTPEAFDGIQLSSYLQKSPGTIEKYADACLLLNYNWKEYEIAVQKMSRLSEEYFAHRHSITGKEASHD